MDAVRFIQDLAVVLSIAAAVLLAFRRLGQPPVLGYLVAGLIIGPHTPPMPLVTDIHTLEVLSEVGVVFLLFALGIEFNIPRLAKAGVTPLLCASLEAVLMLGVGWAAGGWLGWAPLERLLLGGVIAVAGTAIVARTLLERSRRPAGWEELVAGMLIAEDIIAILLIAFFSSAARLGDLGASALLSTAARLGMLSTVLLVAGLIVLPRILRAAERSKMEEVRTMVVVGACFAVALLTQKLGYSAALGAFLAGAMASTGGRSAKLHATVAPFRDVFGAVFFVSVGMLIDPRWLLANWQAALGLVLIVVLARLFVNFIAVAAAGLAPAACAQASLAMLPIGEFSFILAQLAQREGLTARPVYPVAVMLCLGTTLASAQLLPLAGEERVGRLLPRPLQNLFEAYRGGLERLAVPSRAAGVWALIKPSLIQIGANLLGISGLFLAGRAFQESHPASQGFPGALWMAATMVSMPFLMALGRKLQAVAIILLEAMTEEREGPPAEAHPVLLRLVLAASTGFTAWWYLGISWFLLPPWPYALAPLGVVGLAVLLLGRRATRLYAAIQLALRETLTQPPRTGRRRTL